MSSEPVIGGNQKFVLRLAKYLSNCFIFWAPSIRINQYTCKPCAVANYSTVLLPHFLQERLLGYHGGETIKMANLEIRNCFTYVHYSQLTIRYTPVFPGNGMYILPDTQLG